jgi:hypothetical protein
MVPGGERLLAMVVLALAMVSVAAGQSGSRARSGGGWFCRGSRGGALRCNLRFARVFQLATIGRDG